MMLAANATADASAEHLVPGEQAQRTLDDLEHFTTVLRQYIINTVWRGDTEEELEEVHQHTATPLGEPVYERDPPEIGEVHINALKDSVYSIDGAYAWKRWWMFGPLVLVCLCIIFFAGPPECQKTIFGAAAAPIDRIATHVEARQSGVYQHRSFMYTLKKYVDTDYTVLRSQYDKAAKDVANANLLDEHAADGDACSRSFLTALAPSFYQVNYTDPASARSWVTMFGLERWPPVKRVLGDLLKTPVDVTSFVETITGCAANNHLVAAWGCKLLAANGSITVKKSGAAYLEGADVAVEWVTMMMVLEKLTAAAVQNSVLGRSMTFATRAAVEMRGGMVGYQEKLRNEGNPEDVIGSAVDQYHAIGMAMDSMNANREVSDNSAYHGSPLHVQVRAVSNEKVLQLKIIEAVKVESDNGMKDNGYVGVSLATYVTGRGNKYSVDENLAINWRLGKDWIDTYVAWNLAYATSVLPPTYGNAGSLLLPSILCTTDEVGAVTDAWMSSHPYSIMLMVAAATVNHTNGTAFAHVHRAQTTPEFAGGFGRSNLLNLGVPAAEHDAITWMMDSFPSTLAPLAGISATVWQMLECLTLWGSTMVLGWGIEVVSALMLLDGLDGYKGHVNKYNWSLAQLIFPLFLTIAIVGARARSVFALPFLVVGLWKLGFPETCSAFMTAHLTELYDKKLPNAYALSRFMTALGAVFHHSATTWFACILITGIASPGGSETFYMAVVTPLVFQHWVVMTKYIPHCYPFYVVAQIGLEVWWEMEVFASIRKFRYWHEQRTLWAMLVAHWLYFAGAGMNMAFKPRFSTDDHHNEDDDAEVGMMKHAIRRNSSMLEQPEANEPKAEHVPQAEPHSFRDTNTPDWTTFFLKTISSNFRDYARATEVEVDADALPYVTLV